MAAPLVQRVTLEVSGAQRELAALERQLNSLNQPINVPVDVDVAGTQRAENQMGRLRREVDQTGDEFGTLGRKADQSSDAILRVGTRGTSAFTSLKGSIAAVAGGLIALQGASTGLKFAFDAIQSASALQESLSKSSVVFGTLTKEIERFASTAPEALGLSTAAALESTATFGNLFVALGLSQEAAANLSPDIVQLAADLASFNNIAVDEAVEKLRSGLVGEVEPLRTLGVNLNAAMVDAKAFELGMVDASGKVTEAGKVQARYSLILEQTSTAQGDYARTADGIANSQRTLTAEFENAKTAIGEALLPAFQELLAAAPDLIARLEELGPAIGLIATTTLASLGPLVEFATLVGDVVGPIASLVQSSDGLEDSGAPGFFSDIGDAIKGSLNPIGQFNRGIEDIDARISGIDPVKFADLIDNTSAAAAKGRDPIILTDQALTEFLQHSNITVDALNEIIEATGIADEDLTAFLSDTIRNAKRLGLSAAEIRILKDELNELSDVQRRRPGGGPATGADPFVAGKAALDAYRESVVKLGTPMEQLQRVSQETGFSIDFIAGHAELFGANVQGLVNELDAGTLAARGFSEGISAIADGIQFDTSDAVDELDLLVNKVNEAGEEIPQTVRQMNDDLRAQADQLATVEAGTVLLDAMGLTSLADEIRGLPVADAAQALERYLEDTVGAVEANDILSKGGNPGQDIIDSINETIAAGDLTPAMLDYIQTMTSESVKNDILNQALTFGSLTQGAFQDALNALHITLPADFIRVNTEGFLPPPGFQGAVEGATQVTVEQNFFTEPQPTTTTQRAAQEVNSIISGQRGRQ